MKISPVCFQENVRYKLQISSANRGGASALANQPLATVSVNQSALSLRTTKPSPTKDLTRHEQYMIVGSWALLNVFEK